jgi:hypothetical protein
MAMRFTCLADRNVGVRFSTSLFDGDMFVGFIFFLSSVSVSELMFHSVNMEPPLSQLAALMRSPLMVMIPFWPNILSFNYA